MGTGWHIPDVDLHRYAAGELAPPLLWSVEAHVRTCAQCRGGLAATADARWLDRAWNRLDSELDAPRPGALETTMLRLGVPEHTARLLVVTPVLRLSWLSAVLVTLVAVVVGSNLVAGGLASGAAPLPFLAVAPLLPVAGVALCFGRGLDPTHELALVAPMSSFRLLLLRTVVVLATTVTLTAAATLALPGFGAVALGWLLPAAAATLLTLALIPRLGAVIGGLVVALGWAVVLAATAEWPAGTSVVFTHAGQVTAATVTVAAATAVALARNHFDAGRPNRLVSDVTTRRLP
jgi:hypothetical protein